MFQHNQSTIKNEVLTWNRDLTKPPNFQTSKLPNFQWHPPYRKR